LLCSSFVTVRKRISFHCWELLFNSGVITDDPRFNHLLYFSKIFPLVSPDLSESEGKLNYFLVLQCQQMSLFSKSSVKMAWLRHRKRLSLQNFQLTKKQICCRINFRCTYFCLKMVIRLKHVAAKKLKTKKTKNYWNSCADGSPSP
jgi:hypothetical protein